MGGWLSRDGGAADSAAPARRGEDVADLENEEGESPSARRAAELPPDSPASSMATRGRSCYVAWELKHRASKWKAQATLGIHVNLFGLSSEFAADTDAAAEGVGCAVPLNPAERSVEDDFRGSADAYRVACESLLNTGSGGGAVAAEALKSNPTLCVVGDLTAAPRFEQVKALF